MKFFSTARLVFVMATFCSSGTAEHAIAAKNHTSAQQRRPAQPARTTGHLTPAELKQLALQVALDRAGFSPGEIDAKEGPNTRVALDAFHQRATPSTPDTPVDGGAGVAPTSSGAAADPGPSYDPPTIPYAIAPEDVAGPFTERIPMDMMEKAQLKTLGYTGPLELLAERFHVNPALLQRMNPGVALTAGATIVVPNVEPFVPPTKSGKKTADAAPGASNAVLRGASDPLSVVITKGTQNLVVRRQDGTTVFSAPVTIGSEHDPLPIGRWKVTGVALNPVFHYNPDLFWDADASHSKAEVPSGPNSPVGTIWIALTKEHYGIHGTPEPSRVGHAYSHGCIRLTNWDVGRVAALVSDGTEVVFQ